MQTTMAIHRKLNLSEILATGVIIFGVMPFIKILPIPSDTQPHFLLMSILYLMFTSATFPRSFFLISSFVATIIYTAYFLAEPSLYSARNLVNYLSPAVGGLAIYNILMRQPDFRILVKWSLRAMVLYVLAGLLQELTSPSILSAVINVRTSEFRGVTSLTSEPNYFMAMMFFLHSLVCRSGTIRENNVAFVLFAFTIVFLATSVIGSLLFALAFVQFMKKKFDQENWSLRIIFIFAAGFTSFIFLHQGFHVFLYAARLEKVITSFLEIDFRLLMTDGSASGRFSSIFMAFYGSFSNSLLPTLPDSFHNFYSMNIGDFRHLFPYGNPTERPMSAIGSYVYDFGLIGIFTSIFYIACCFTVFRGRIFLFAGSVFLALFVFPFSHPLYAFIVGTSCALRKRKLQKMT